MDHILLPGLLIAHILGDFVLQPDGWVRQRNARHFASPWLYVHGLVHFILALLVAPQAPWIAVSIGLGHIVLDGLKAWSQRQGLLIFLLDQALHGLIILMCWMQARQVFDEVLEWLRQPRILWAICGYLLVTVAYSRLIALATSRWRQDIPPERELLLKAGRWIGIIERSLVLTFVLIGQFGAIGFLLAAKSVFRFGDLKEGRDKGHTEYVLIGTLLSFGLTIITGLVIARLMEAAA